MPKTPKINTVKNEVRYKLTSEEEEEAKENGYNIQKYIIESLPTLGESVYKRMPNIVLEWLEWFNNDIDKDIFIKSTLATAGAFFSETTRTKWWGSIIYPTYYGFICANSGGGKSATNKAMYLFQFEQEKRKQRYKDSIKQWNEWRELDDERARDMKKPTSEKFNLSGGSSSQFIQYLDNAQKYGEGCVIHRSEADSLVSDMQGQHGDKYSGYIRDSFDYATISHATKTDGVDTEINTPKLSVCIAGTHDQPRNMFSHRGNSSNGLFQRFDFYLFNRHRPIHGDIPTTIEDAKKDDDKTFFGKYANRLEKLKKQKVMFIATPNQLQYMNDIFDTELKPLFSSYYRVDDVESILIRTMAQVPRVAMSLSRLNKEYDKEYAHFDDDMFLLAVDIMAIFAQHTFAAFSLYVDGYKKQDVNVTQINLTKNQVIYRDFLQSLAMGVIFKKLDFISWCSTHEIAGKDVTTREGLSRLGKVWENYITDPVRKGKSNHFEKGESKSEYKRIK